MEKKQLQSEQPPAEFLDTLGKSLTEDSDSDQELAKILVNYILKAAPAQDAVARAEKAIIELAAKRASPINAGAIDG